MPTLAEWGQKIAGAALPQRKIRYGPWRGSMRSRSADQVPREFIAAGSNFHYLPAQGWWKRRKGQTQQFDTFGSAVGSLPAKWGAKCRQMEEFVSDSIVGGVPTVCALLTKETISSGLDDGRFSNFWLRDQVNAVNYTLGSEFDTTRTYPAPGTVQTLKHIPLWYDSGDGGISRGVTEFQRRLMLNGSRSFMKAGTQHYFPSQLGTPSRWNSRFTSAAALLQTARPSSDDGTAGLAWGKVGGPTSFFDCLNDTDADTGGTDYVRFTGGVGGAGDGVEVRLGSVVLSDPGVDTGFTLKLTLRSSNNTNARMIIELANFGGATFMTRSFGYATNTGQTVTEGNVTNSFVQYTISLTSLEGAAFTSWGTAPLLALSFSGAEGSATFDFAQAEFSVGSVATPDANRLIPSGPIPPTHCGYITKGTPVLGSTSEAIHPISDVSTGGWTAEDGVSTTDLYKKIDEHNTSGDPVSADYMRAFGSSTSTAIMTLEPFAFTPAADDTVKLRWAAYRLVISSVDLTVVLTKADGTEIASSQQTLPHTGGGGVGQFFEYTLQRAQIETVSDWTTLRLKVVASGGGASDQCRLTWAEVEFTPVGSALGGWHGADRFPFGLYYRFEDDSVWAFTTPRLPNTTLASGLGIFTVDSANPTLGYDKITWTLPVPPAGVKRVGMVRGTKIDSSTEDNLAMNLHDMRIVAEVDAGVTSYDDYAADDDALVLDVDKLFIHEDHIMPPRCRWNFPGDMRACHANGGISPAAITLAPAGFTADWDLADESDTSSNAFASLTRSYYKITGTTLTLVWDNGSTTSTRVFTFGTGVGQYATLQALVDAINDTSTADTDWSGGAGKAAQWRAQVLPGVNPDAAATYLCPTSRAITSCVVSGQTISKAAGGLSAIPIGAFITDTTDTGAYVSAINSDILLTFVGTVAAATKTLTFVAATGDAITGATLDSHEGYIRVIANSLPGFLYFTKTYLNQFPIEKSAVWITTASPESNRSAPNCFKGLGANKLSPPETAGTCMGGAGVDQGFFIGFSGKRAIIKNTRDNGTGRDSDYRLIITSEASGVCGPIAKGNRCAFAFAPEGWIGADLNGEIPISGDIWQHPRSDAVAGVGDFAYEMPQCVAAAGADTDTGLMFARVMRNALWVNYRMLSGSTTHPDRQVCYDFSASNRSGVAALLRDQPVLDDEGRVAIPPGVLWGWSLPLARAMTCMVEGRRADGAHLYGWNQANAGSTGDGRIDEMETSDTDNGTAISASPGLTVPWESLGNSDNIAAREIVFEHSSPAGATVQGQFSRSFTGDAYTCTPDVSSTLVVSVYRWMLPLAARVHSAACTLGWAQTAGGASELRSMELRASTVRDYKPGTAG